MRVVTKSVYYCDWCARHGLSRVSIERHEASCTLNPRRVCGWRIDGHSDGTRTIDVAALAATLRALCVSYPVSSDPEADERTYLARSDVEWLRAEVDGCPACMLAALRQSGVDEFHHEFRSGEMIFDYQAEVERLRREEREAQAGDVW